MTRLPWCALAMMALFTLDAAAKDAQGPPLAGVNLAGAEFGSGKLPGRPGTDYVFPSQAQIDWVAGQGFGVIRLPVLWERLQPVLSGPLDTGELGRVQAVVERAGERGVSVVVDVHNFGRYRGKPVGSAEVPGTAFADLWRRLAIALRPNRTAIFGLMNEPQVAGTDAWRGDVQKALDAIRAAGATNLVLVPGAGWDGAHNFTKPRSDQPSNAVAMAALTDPGHNVAFEVHQYLDADFSGTHAACPAADRIEAILQPFTDWLRAGGRRGFLGEFAASARPECLGGLARMLAFMDANRDVWAGWTYWAAGSWWPADYPFSLEPRDGVERPQLQVLRPSTR